MRGKVYVFDVIVGFSIIFVMSFTKTENTLIFSIDIDDDTIVSLIVKIV